MRVALYWAPALDDRLHEVGSAWLGRDAETGARLRQPGAPGLADATSAAALYGFHATLRPPMRLATGWAEFMDEADRLACGTPPFPLPDLVCGTLDDALVLLEANPSPSLAAFADACVAATDRHRLPPNEAELARRRRVPLSAEHEAMLLRWGYPYVMRQWRFHVTLSRRLSNAEMRHLRPAAEAHFAQNLDARRMVRELCVFTQADETAPFLIAERLSLQNG